MKSHPDFCPAIRSLATIGLLLLALVSWAQAQVYEKVFSFTEAARGGPLEVVGFTPAGLVRGNDGNYYGTTRNGGANNYGTVFKLTPAGEITTLVEFTGYGATNKGSQPMGGWCRGPMGTFTEQPPMAGPVAITARFSR